MEDNDRCGPYKTCRIAEAYNDFLSLNRGEVRPQVVNVNFQTSIYNVQNVGTKCFFCIPMCYTCLHIFKSCEALVKDCKTEICTYF